MEPLNEFPELPEYNQLIKSVEAAINRDILPERIYQVINSNLVPPIYIYIYIGSGFEWIIFC